MGDAWKLPLLTSSLLDAWLLYHLSCFSAVMVNLFQPEISKPTSISESANLAFASSSSSSGFQVGLYEFSGWLFRLSDLRDTVWALRALQLLGGL